jgi:hypothetical protein
MKQAFFRFNRDELEVLLYILGDWQDIKSNNVEYVFYPNRSASSTKFFHLFNRAFKSLLKDELFARRKI